MDKKFCPYCMSPVEPGETCPVCGLTEGSYTPSAHHLPPGTVLMDRYLVGRVLGEGGFGITYIGCDLRLELKVAIKEYFPTDRVSRFSQSSLSVSNYTGAASKNYEAGKIKFLQEARTMARMDKQPEIVSVRDYFEANNTAYIVMEYVEGTTFKELVKQKGGRIPAGELLYLIEPLFPALSAMHSLGLIHRDISPDNLMLEKGSVRLLDFGCARESASGTETMTIALKHGYAPIEQYQHKGQGPWTDVYALSATIYFCLTGKVPQQSLDRLCEDELILPRRLGVDLTEHQEQALLYGMGIRPRRRFQSVEELHTALYLGGPVPRIIAEPPIAGPRSGYGQKRSENQDSAGGQKTEAYEEGRSAGQTGNPTGSLSESQSGIRQADLSGGQQTGSQTSSGSDEGKEDIIAQKDTEKKAPRQLYRAAGGAAALLLVILLIVLWPRGSSPVVGTTAGADSTVSSDEIGSVTAEENRQDETDMFAQAAVLDQCNEVSFRAAMESDNVSAVILPEGTYISLMESALEITKPLLIQEGAGLNVMAPLTVRGEGVTVTLEGTMTGESMVHTCDGGQICVADTGRLDGCLEIWAENETDIQGNFQGEAQNVFVNYMLTIPSEEKLFAGARRVSSMAELDVALADSRVESVIIESDIVLTHGITQNKPVRIDEGVTVTALSADPELINPASEDMSWFIQDGAVLYNHGAIIGRILAGWSEGQESGCYLINYGEILINGRLFLDDGSIVFNLGRMEIETYFNVSPESRLYNTGTMCLSDTGIDTVDGKDLKGNVFNYGELEVSSFTRIAANRFSNSGQIRIKDGGTVMVTGYLLNYGNGVIHLEEGGRLENRALIEQFNCGSMSNEGGEFDNGDGIMIYEDTVDLGWPGEELNGYHYGYTNDIRQGDCIMGVSTEEELWDALANPDTDAIVIEADVTVTKDLSCTVNLEIGNGASLTMVQGTTFELLQTRNLINRGTFKVDTLILMEGCSFNNGGGLLQLYDENSRLLVNDSVFGNWGATEFAGGTLETSGTGLVVSFNPIDNCNLSMTSGVFVNKGWLRLENARLENSRLINIAYLELGGNGEVTVAADSSLHNFNTMDLTDSERLIIEENGVLVSEDGHMEWSDNTHAVNEGRILVSGTEQSHFAIDSALDNYRDLEIVGDVYTSLRGTGRLNNEGEVRCIDGGQLDIHDGAVYTGNEPVNQ